MAILQEHPTIEAYVECNGVRLQEFNGDEPETSATAITRYIEAASGAEFAVQLALHKPFPVYAMIIKLSIDGKVVRSRIIGDRQYTTAKASIKRTFDDTVSKMSDGQRTLRKFCFSELQIEDLDDCDVGASLARSLKSMGVITLEAHYIRHLREVARKDRRVDKKRVGVGPIPEKALKGEALTHCMGLGTAVDEPYVHSSHTIFDYVHPLKVPFATFNFKYRSRTALQSLLIVPRTPCPRPLPVRDDAAFAGVVPELKREDIRVDVKMETGLKREHSAIVADDEDEKEVLFLSAVKRPRPNITTNENGVETIDLT